MKREYDENKIGFIETTDDGLVTQRVKKFYGHPQYYRMKVEHPITKEVEEARFENAIQSWRSF
jgi:hypothetical protein